MARPEPHPSLRERNKRDKQARIEAAARRLFAERGYEQTTLRDVAAEAEVGVGTVFLYYADKSDLIVRIFQSEISAAQERAFETLPRGGELADQLLHVFGAFLDFYGLDLRLGKVIAREMMFLGAREDVALFNQVFFTRLAALIHERQAAGELRADLDVYVAVVNFFAAYMMALLALVSAHMPRLEVDALFRAALSQQIAGMLRQDRRE